MRFITTLIFACMAQIAFANTLIESAEQFSKYERNFDSARLAAFKQDLSAQEQALEQARASLAAEEKRAEELREQFSDNEEILTEKTEALRIRTGSLGEMFGVVRQVAGDLRTVTSSSITRIDGTDTPADLDALAESKALPDLGKIKALWQTLRQEASLSSEVAQISAPVVQADGSTADEQSVRIGAFTVVGTSNGGQYLIADEQLGALRPPYRQPGEASLLNGWLGSSGVALVGIDPSRGALLNIEAATPSIVERIQQGGTIGYIIIALGVIGLLIALWRLFALLQISAGMRRQLSDKLAAKDDNALGRVMIASLGDRTDAELLEARLDEAVLRELPAIERGQSIIKLLAGIAPLMGLLGTVTGMIATFQAITAFGSGDAKLMAAGISQALITTVLGLVVAVPLLLLHSWVASRSRELVHILDEQSAGIIAEAQESSRK
ncbi:outer membrane transport energization protein ExbB [Thalassolituus maritimus]|uniref:Outer membrane transport energization protein ExbB n=1 Tax=Thalassolituus maritimus TaxID=484498 RepID=A0A1N7L9U0_9GAMM|nr:MotA/TolQ/ExbB proton channel family protein [Thalassolituus maritimus]SIS70606.1 outer membrane transport energization protein ExbB [Thalassolituus maritimus]